MKHWRGSALAHRAFPSSVGTMEIIFPVEPRACDPYLLVFLCPLASARRGVILTGTLWN